METRIGLIAAASALLLLLLASTGWWTSALYRLFISPPRTSVQ
jgi:hypothetical protein